MRLPPHVTSRRSKEAMPAKIRQLKRELSQVGFVVYLHYSMLLEWDPEDEIYVVTAPELPGCLRHGRTLEEAID
jgi:hypothetical protein